MTDPRFTYHADYRGGRQLGVMERFIRGSTATRYNRLGNLESVIANQARFNFNPLTLECRGLLIEDRGTNLLLNSQCDTGWSSAGTTPPAVTNGLTFAGEACGSVTFNSSLVAGYLGARAQRLPGAAPVLGNGVTYCWQLRIALSRPLVSGESVSVYYTGGYGMERVAIGPSHPASTTAGEFVNIGNAGTTVAGPDGVIYPVVYSDTVMANPITVYMNCGQVEAGRVPSSYIPTAGTAAVRQAGFVSIDSTALSRIMLEKEGTLFFEGVVSEWAGTHENLIMVTDTTDQNLIGIQRTGDTQWTFFSRLLGAAHVTRVESAGIAPGNKIRVAFSFRSGRWIASLNGSTTIASTDVDVPVYNNMRVGNGASGASWRGHVTQWGTVARALNVAELTDITK